MGNEQQPEPVISRGFRGRPPDDPSRLPPGQYETRDFPVLATGPTPLAADLDGSLSVWGAVDRERSWSLDELLSLGSETVTVDIHCVTQWSKFDTTWTGVPLDRLMEEARPAGATHLLAHCAGGYTTNLALADVTGGRAWIAHTFEGAPLTAAHGGPARLLVPHLYFWKSAKWICGLELLDGDRPGYWEVNGYHNRGDPWREQRYEDD